MNDNQLGKRIETLSRQRGFSQAEIAIAEYTQQTNYKEEFQSMESLLKDISTSLNRY